MTRAIAVLSILLLTGCTLYWADRERPSEIMGEVMARTIMLPLTLGVSEMGLAMERQRVERREAFARWYAQATPEERAAYQERVRLLLPLLLQTRPMEIPASPARQEPFVLPPPVVRCQSLASGDFVQTWCR
jgi:hypothetical protein